MARIANTVMNGARGSVGAFTYSANAAGGFVRQRIKPTNPKSLAQQSARLSFRQAGKTFSGLTQVQRDQWQDFALSTFNPFKKKNKKNYTAAQACTALHAAQLNANAAIATSTGINFGGTSNLDCTFDLMSLNNTPPLTSVSPEIQDGAGFAAALRLRNIWINSSNICVFDIAYEGMQSGVLAGASFQDINDNKYGFGIYMSEAVTQPGIRPKNQFKSLIGFTGIIKNGTFTQVGKVGVRFSVDCTNQFAKMKSQPLLGQNFLVTIAITDENGTQTKVDSAYVVFGTAASALPSA